MESMLRIAFRLFALLCAGSIVVLLASLMCQGAPAPLPRAAKAGPCPLPAECVMVWGGVRYRAWFAPCGAYASETPGGSVRYSGRWSLAGRTLTIEEVTDGADCWHSYRIDLAESLRDGAVGGWGAWRLEPPAPPEPEPGPAPREVPP